VLLEYIYLILVLGRGWGMGAREKNIRGHEEERKKEG